MRELHNFHGCQGIKNCAIFCLKYPESWSSNIDSKTNLWKQKQSKPFVLYSLINQTIGLGEHFTWKLQLIMDSIEKRFPNKNKDKKIVLSVFYIQ